MSHQEIEEIIDRYLKNQCTAAERDLVDKWFDAVAGDSDELDAQTQSIIKKRLWSRIGSMVPERRSRWTITRVAASLFLLAASAFALFNYFHSGDNIVDTVEQSTGFLHFVNTESTVKKITMNDNSVISLEPGSEVSFAEVFGDKREVYLSGEAFFEVTRNINQPFLVYANEVTTRVLGTSFLVKAYKEEKEIVVAVKTGKVSVFTNPPDENKNTREEIIVTPNQQVVYKRRENLTMKMIIDNPQVIDQQLPPKTNYVNAPVTEIFRSLEKSYGIDIRYDENALAGCTLTYADITEEGLYEQIEIICNALGARYKREEFSILIEAEGCRKNAHANPLPMN